LWSKSYTPHNIATLVGGETEGPAFDLAVSAAVGDHAAGAGGDYETDKSGMGQLGMGMGWHTNLFFDRMTL